MNRLPQPESCPLGISVLAVSPTPEDHRALLAIFQHSRWELRTATTCAEARKTLNECVVPVVLSEYRLDDGDWRDVLNAANQSGSPCRVLVMSRNADERVWAEVLNEGGYDCLAKPLRADEVFRVVSLAWQSWKAETDRLTRRPPTSTAGSYTLRTASAHG
jgi:DNA-binding NtrC family response regulator